MNRLTSEEGQLYACGNGLCSDGDIECANCRYADEAFLKLAEYEDTGFTPEEFTDLKVCLEDEGGTLGIVRDLIELMQYRKLEEQGLLIKLPCKIGKKLFYIETVVYADGYSIKRVKTVKEIELTNHNIFEIINEWGKTIFLTREEAEKALEEATDE